MENPNFYLEGVIREKEDLQNFEGPLSVILMLLSKNKIEIKDIKIADILDQYLAYLEKMQEMDMEIASEFVQMASHLLYIKTRMLLTDEKEPISELEELIASLEKLKSKDIYTNIQEVIPQYRKAVETGILYMEKPQEALPKTPGVYEYRHDPVQLLNVLVSVFMRGGKKADVSALQAAVPQKFIYSVRDKSRELLARLSLGKSSLSELVISCESKTEVIATFLSILEMCSMGSLQINCDENNEYIVEFIGGNAEEILEKIEE